MTRKILISLAAIALASPASAADLYQSGATAPYTPVNTWTGFYAGVNGGYGWSAKDSSVYAEVRNIHALNTSSIRPFEKDGGFGGGQIGYNYQVDRFVFGLEADIQAGVIRGTNSAEVSASLRGVTATASTYRESGLDWFGTVRGRLGYTVDKALIYATGGFAYGGVSGTASTTLSVTTRGHELNETYGIDGSATRTGYAAGGGVEYALDPQWSLKAEYQYLDLGSSRSYVGYTAGDYRARGYYDIEQSFHTVRVGLNYKMPPQGIVEPLK